MNLQLIRYYGQIVAVAGEQRFWLSHRFARRAAVDPERAWIIYMCAYARDVLCGELPGPYTDGNARLYARAALIPDRLIDSATVDVPGAARAFGIPAHELGAARREWWDRLSP
jgi:hypothetical protein